MKNFKNFDKEYDTSRPLYIIGSGGSVYGVNLPKLIKTNNGEGIKAYCMTINRTFTEIYRKWSLIPDFAVTYDPNEFVNSSVPYLEKINHKKILEKTQLFMPYDAYTCKLHFSKKPPAIMKKAQERMGWLDKHGQITIMDDPFFTFNTHKISPIPAYVNGMEHKLTMVALPLAYKLGFREIYLLGTDYNHTTGHWYNESEQKGKKTWFQKQDVYVTMPNVLNNNIAALKYWNSFFNSNDGNIKSLIPNHLTPIHKAIKQEKIKV